MTFSSKNTANAFVLIISSIILFFPLKGAAMSFLFGTEVVLFSPMEGKLTFEGKPAAGAKIKRTLIWKGDAGETDYFYANDKGEFSLPIRKERVRIPLLAEFVITQEISVYYHENEFFIWFKSKQDLDEYGELGGKPVNLRCEITEEASRIESDSGLFGTSCKWDSIEKREESK